MLVTECIDNRSEAFVLWKHDRMCCFI